MCVEASRVVSWSLNVRSFHILIGFDINSDLLQAMNNSDTLRLLASIELACYRCKQALMDPRLHYKARRRVERIIKDDRRKRHRRRKDQDAMVDAFARQTLTNEVPMLPPAHIEGVGAPLIETMNSLVVSEEQILTT